LEYSDKKEANEQHPKDAEATNYITPNAKAVFHIAQHGAEFIEVGHATTSAILASASCRVLATSMMPLSSLIAINVPPKRDGRSIKRIELVLIANAIARVVELAM
jgi:hypothetical protein